MKRAWLAVVVLAAGAAAGRADEPAPDAAPAYLERFAGQWHTTVVLGDFRGLGVASAGWSDDRSALLGREKLFTRDLGAPWGTSAWHGRWVLRRVGPPGVVRMNYATADGPLFEDEVTVTREGPKLTGRGKRLLYEADGKALRAELLVESPDEDHITLRVPGDGKRPGFTLRMTRVRFADMEK